MAHIVRNHPLSGQTHNTSISMASSTLQGYHQSLASHYSEILKASDTTETRSKSSSKSSFFAYIISVLKLVTNVFTIPTSSKTTVLDHPTQTTMPSQTKTYAPSTYSVSTTCSYEKTPQQPTKAKRSFKQRVKDAVKDIGSSPFEYDDREKASFAWAAQMPPSRI